MTDSRSFGRLDKALDVASLNQTIVSMKYDWRRVFMFQ